MRRQIVYRALVPAVCALWALSLSTAAPRAAGQRAATRGHPPLDTTLFTHSENCVACHSGPAAVAEIRTKHPERANCRQCHVALDPDADAFSRPRQVAAGAGSPP